jgi:hypothetical protein
MCSDESARGSRRFFAVTSLGRNRWYWVVWPSLEELQASEETLLHVGDGYEKSKAEAVERALRLAGRHAEWIAAKYAKAYHRSKSGAREAGDDDRAAEPSVAPSTQEFLYRDVRDAVTGRWRSVPHRVVRKTSKYVYVEQCPYFPDDVTGSWLDHGRQTFRLDRRMLEQEGYAFVPVTVYVADTEDPMVFTRPYHKRVGLRKRESPECLEMLELTWPCTVVEVKSAYRRLAKCTHPDGGGSHDEFLALQAAYEEALRLCGCEWGQIRE